MKRSALILIALLLAGCGQDSTPPSGLPVIHMKIGGQDYSLEIATSQHDQEVGLMHRDHLDADHGMLFAFAQEQTHSSFWNHDVHFPLDVIFLDKTGTVVDILQMKAFDDTAVTCSAPTDYAIELNLGTAAKLGVIVGSHLDIPAVARGQ